MQKPECRAREDEHGIAIGDAIARAIAKRIWVYCEDIGTLRCILRVRYRAVVAVEARDNGLTDSTRRA